MATQVTLIEELERVLLSGSDRQRDDMLSRITDLFLTDAGRYSEAQIGLFDEVITKLASAIETKARAKLSIRLAEVPTAPTGVVRMLAFDDDIEVARPILKNSSRLDESDLIAIANAKGKSQQHLAAISERPSLSEAVTDVLVKRGDREVVHSVARNKGARFSDAGFRALVKRSSNDGALAVQIGTRRDLPRQHFLRLLEQASATVRSRLAAENPEAAAAVEGVLSEVVGGIRTETRKISSQYADAVVAIGKLKQEGRLGEAEVYQYARENRFEEATIALSLLSGVELDAIERALHDRGHEIALILSKLAGFSSTTAKAILLLKTADRGISAQDLDVALRTYEKLQVDTARRVLSFYRTRLKGRGNQSLAAAG